MPGNKVSIVALYFLLLPPLLALFPSRQLANVRRLPAKSCCFHTLSADLALLLAAAFLVRDVTRGTTTSMPTIMKRTPKIATSSVRTLWFGRLFRPPRGLCA